ncbi:glycosyltransferase family 8 protein [Streptococcus loxodontisalivarius]|uniref:Lipopolysaccharide biosynthesis glycosyltransferase n=1 Tax=Streptococcus loxodontisalivarius TaxID=1349415 RepID=A0ABS2PQQ9_9STRE|nr:glycosyltransferase family 8 protein [Streptococcus loxodontisalivarius]MBM7642278.1 lipopolysaccharide biosynthesis glycosyltransferase [Streptococcus loxodontisalivarius]
MTKEKALVLAGDYKYIRSIETTLKSICYHNKELRIYIFNQDIPKEWFIHHRRLLRSLGSDLVDVKLFDRRFNQSWTIDQNLYHINQMTFARYFIPEYVSEDKVLYLDSDLLVTGDLSGFFNQDINDYYLAASHAAFGYGHGFNAGVMLINNKRWKAEGIFEQLIQLTNQKYTEVPEGDQSILNMLLGHNYLELPHDYNFQIGYDRGAAYYGQREIFQLRLDPLPLILHYVSDDKPWNTHSSGRLREVWWQYHLMDWTQILAKWGVRVQSQMAEIPKKQALIVTNTESLEGIEYLAQQLEDVIFHIAAFTDMGPNLKRLDQYENVLLHPKVIGYLLEDLIKEVDVYLDINYGTKFKEILDLVLAAQKPIYAFKSTVSDFLLESDSYHLIENQAIDRLVTILKEM